MKNLPLIIYTLLIAASLYACNKKDDQEAMNPYGHSRQLDTLYHHDTTYTGNDPTDTTYYGNDPTDTIDDGYPYDTIWGDPTDTIYHGGNGYGGIDSTLISGDSLSQ